MHVPPICRCRRSDACRRRAAVPAAMADAAQYCRTRCYRGSGSPRRWSRAPWPLPLIEGDRDLLFIAVQNLVANAVKFSSPGDTVEVRASEDDHALLLEVADTGAGIPADEIGQVWQELARGRAARSLPGTGIGLALVRVIVTRHGGQVAIRSREGEGTVVSIRLPVQGRPGTGPPVADLRQHRDSRGTVPA